MTAVDSLIKTTDPKLVQQYLSDRQILRTGLAS